MEQISKGIRIITTLLLLLSPAIEAHELQHKGVEKFAVLPFIAWRNDLLVADALFSKLPRSLPCTACLATPCEGWNAPRALLPVLGEIGTGEVKLHGPEFDYNSVGFEIAADVQRTRNWIVGAVGSALWNNISWHHNGGHADLQHYNGGIYANYCRSWFFVGGMISGGWNESHCRRHLIDKLKAKSSQHGADFAFHFQEGLYYHYCEWDIMPIFRVSYVSLYEKSFHERGADGIDLDVHCWTTELLRAYLEGRVTRRFDFCSWSLIPKFFVGYAYDSAIGGKHIHARQKSDDESFTTKVWSRNQGSVIIGTEATFLWEWGLTLFARYNAQLNNRYTAQYAALGAAWAF